MRDHVIQLPTHRTAVSSTLKRCLLAAMAGAVVLGAAAGAQAGDGNGKRYQGYYGPAYVKVPPGHVRYVAPAPVVYVAPAPVAYAAPAPVVVYPAPVAYVPAYPAYGAYPGGNLSIGLNLPLR